MKLSDFNYHLPEELIAQSAVVPRNSSRLLVVDGKHNFHDKHFFDIVDYLQSGDVMVVNASKVTHAKLLGAKKSGSLVEIVLEKKVSDTIWHAKIKGRNPRIGTVIYVPFKDNNIPVTIIDMVNESFVIEIDNPIILQNAILPTPPYITRTLDDSNIKPYMQKLKVHLLHLLQDFILLKAYLNK